MKNVSPRMNISSVHTDVGDERRTPLFFYYACSFSFQYASKKTAIEKRLQQKQEEKENTNIQRTHLLINMLAELFVDSEIRRITLAFKIT